MALLPKNPRDQKLLMVGLLSIGLAAVYQQLYWTPKNAELTALSTRLDTLDSLNRDSKLEVAKGNSAKMKAEAEGYSRELSVLRHLVPTSNEVPSLLEAISNAGRSAGLEVSEVAPDSVTRGDQFDTYKYRLGVTGPYHQVADFLANIASLQRIVSPINLSIVPSARVGSEIKPKKGEQFLEAKFSVQTYVAHNTPAQTGSAKPGSP